jgi:hypothetical protein
MIIQQNRALPSSFLALYAFVKMNSKATLIILDKCALHIL